MDKRLKNISKVSVALALCAASATATVAIPKTDNVMAAAKKTAKYSYRVQTKKITRTIKMYQPKGMKKVVQKAYIKRKVKTNKKTKKKTYGKWSTSSWKKYKVAKVSGYTASRAVVGAAKVTRKNKNQTIKITYKAIKKAAKKRIKKTVKKTTPKKSTTAKKTVKKTTPASANVTVYNSKGKPIKIYKRIKSEFGPSVETHIKKGSAVVVFGQGPINGQLMYNIPYETKNGGFANDGWVPAKDVKVDYFTDVNYADYDTYHFCSIPAEAKVTREARLANAKANYEAKLAKIEKDAKTAEDISEGLMVWFDAHPLEDLREESQTVKIAKSTYEKHNQTYAQRLAYRSRMGLGWTKESYTAYMKGEAAYRQYEAKWAAKYPNITKNMTKVLDDSYYKKYNLNTFEWHYNDKFFTVKNIRK